ncbi:MAG TPA: AAA family ATPase [Syntrophales bacterium]|jgi:uncharacterized protein YhaN|nr:AAA family ATPase [Syntrophales bacterium]HPL66971.1 AAA family ATPase [Smithellaceae bacterium]HQG34531.1 AAA family ATPase [Syntrophales bacterium]HQI36143.1 AAA family ATPase [Syntrophales bacterium]HRR47865.1 AAA family ATPase [Syntrophales bacterium]
MRILELHLKAFGPFTDLKLSFAEALSGLYIVYGGNEAGKSSALRALTDFLYGIPVRTRDGFLHGNDQLRIGGRICLADGRTQYFVRRKGQKNTLLTPDERQAVKDEELAPYLAGINREMFTTMFGIDHEELVRGGNDILTNRGKVGEALLSAAIGAEKFRTLLKELENASNELFSPRASKPRINSSLSELKGLRDKVRKESLPAREWDQHWKRRQDLEQERQAVDEEIKKLQVEQHRLTRIQRVLKGLTERQGLLTRLSEMGAVHTLAIDFPVRRAACLKELENAKEEKEKISKKLENLRLSLAKLELPSPLLDDAMTVDDLQQDLGSHLKALKDKPDLEGRLRQMKNDARLLMETIGIEARLEAVGEIIPRVERNRVLVLELARLHEAVLNAKKKAEKTWERKIREQEGMEKEYQGLPELCDPSSLREAVRRAQKAGDLDGELGKARKTLKAIEKKAQLLLSGLGLWKGDIDNVLTLPIPVKESLDRYEEEFQTALERRKEIERKAKEIAAASLDVREKLDSFNITGKVPTEANLDEARKRRQSGWALIRRALVEGIHDEEGSRAFSPDMPLEDAYEVTVANADDIADRLRREAQRVHVLADLQAAERSLAEQREQIEAESARQVERENRIENEWQALWAPCDIKPHSPKEMRAWLVSFRELCTMVVQMNQAVDDLKEVELKYESCLVNLREALRPFKPDVDQKQWIFHDLLAEADRCLENISEQIRKHQELKKQIEKNTGQIREAATEKEISAAELQAWQEKWQSAMTGLGLAPDTLPAQAMSVLEQYAELFNQAKSIDEMARRIWAVNQEVSRFQEKVTEFARRKVPEYASYPPQEIVLRLKDDLDRARVKQEERQNHIDRIGEMEEDLGNAEVTCAIMEQKVADLLKEALCHDPSEFEAAEDRSSEYLRHKQRLEAVEQFLLENGDGLPLADLEAESASITPDEIPASLENISKQLDERISHRQELNTKIGEENAELRRMNGLSIAATAEEQAQAILASLRNDVEKYHRVRAAYFLLKNAMDRYREKNQAPLLIRAGEIFARITNGAFPKLTTDIGPDDEPVLTALRNDGARLGVEGMSSGTRDQLYLALRLATAETYLHGEPMPFIVDDVLVNFDEERGAATLGVLQEMAERTQVILFTHHRHIVDMATEIMKEQPEVFIRNL